MADLDLGTLRGHVDLDTANFEKKYKDVDSTLDDLARRDIPDVEIGADASGAERAIDQVEQSGEQLSKREFDPQIDADIAKAQKKVDEATRELEVLGKMEASPDVEADIARAQRNLGKAESRLKALDGIRAEMDVEADVSSAEGAIEGLGEEGAPAGEEAGAGLSEGITSSLKSIPVAGAIIGIGVAIGAQLLQGIKDGLAIEANRDLLMAQTGLDEATAAKVGRAAGESYADTFGESVELNLQTARYALSQGLIDEHATQREIEEVVSQLSAITSTFDYDIPQAARAAGQLIKSGLVENAEEAFDLIAAASQGVMSDDLMDTIVEYSTQWEIVGITAEQAFGLIRQGLEAGARDTDKIADAVKEMGLRIREGTDPARESLSALGLDVDHIIEAFRAGGPEGASAMDEVFDALRRLDEQGGNTQSAIANLFGGPGEDLGASLFALDLSTVQDALGETEGKADSLLQTLTDNASSDIEEAQRNIEVAADGIKGALAAAFGDEAAGAADWVTRNRAPLMQFFLDAINGAFDFAENFVTGLAMMTRTTGEFLAGPLADMLSYLVLAGKAWSAISGVPFDTEAFAGAVEDLRDSGETMQDMADTMEDEWKGALQDMQDDLNEWAAPELMSAKIHDATVAMTQRIDEFTRFVDNQGGTIEINGETLKAEEAMQALVGMIDGETGTVTINGKTVPAEDALDLLMEQVKDSEEPVTITADHAPASETLELLMDAIKNSKDSVTIGGQDRPAHDVLDALMHSVAASGESITIGGQDYPAQHVLDRVLNAVDSGHEYVTIDGNKYPAEAATNALMSWIDGQREWVVVDADTSAAQAAIYGLQSLAITLGGFSTGGYVGEYAGGGEIPGFPGGGHVSGPGTGVSDSILARVSNGEYVIRADMVDYYGRGFFDALNGGTMPVAPAAASPAAPNVQVMVQSPVDGRWVDARARVVVDGALRGVSRELANTAGVS